MAGSSPPGLSIVRLTADNARLLDRIAPEVFDAPIEPGRLAAYLAWPGTVLLLGLIDGEVIGHVSGVVRLRPEKPPEMFVDELGVTPARRRQGIATALMQAMLKVAHDEGCDQAWLGTEGDNHAAQAVYDRLGGRREAMVLYTYDTGD